MRPTVSCCLYEEVDRNSLISKARELYESNARFMSLVCNDKDDHFELIYYFERGSDVLGVKTRVRKGEKAQSITSVYPCAFLAENEVKDMFELEFTGLSPDIGGALLRTSETGTLLKPATGERPPLFRTPARCFLTCPANTDIPRYLHQIAEGKFEEALETNLEVNPLPAVLGRVCFAPCETACRRAKNGDPLSIRALKRFAADIVGIYPRNVKRKASTGKRVAVIGAGPAGVAAAYYLGLLGHQVVVFDELPRPGGMLLVGIPKYRLPKDVLFAEIEARFKEAGVEFRPNTRIEDLDELFAQGFHAIFIATGAHKGSKLGI
ncbi:MAG: NADH-quinone oxidoreductase subunit C, partial [Candidatus Korarchaeum sp.]|nr:NADH-quinone oxidoreductase subunit C [Candidatus Korarchaeum sp.]